MHFDTSWWKLAPPPRGFPNYFCYLLGILAFLLCPAFAHSKASLLNEMTTAYQGKKWSQILKLSQKHLGPKKASRTLKNYSSAQQAKMYLYVGVALYHSGQKVVSAFALRKACSIDTSITMPEREPVKLHERFRKIHQKAIKRTKFKEPFRPKQDKKVAAKKSSGIGLWPMLTLISGSVALGSLIVAVGAGVNTQINAESVRNNLFRSAQKNSFPEPLMTPTLNSMHERASSQSLIANIFYITAGVAGVVASVTTVLWLMSDSKPKKVSSTKTPPKDSQSVLFSFSSR